MKEVHFDQPRKKKEETNRNAKEEHGHVDHTNDICDVSELTNSSCHRKKWGDSKQGKDELNC